MKDYVITAVGDIAIADQPLCFGFGVRSLYHPNYKNLISQKIRNILKNGDLTIGNLESSYDFSEKMQFGVSEMCAHKNGLDFLKKCNFSLLNIANNHTLDKGEDKLHAMLDYLNRKDVQTIGLKNSVFIHTFNHKRIAYIAYDCIPNNYDNSLLNNWTKNSLKDIKELSLKYEFVVVIMHWGYEFIDQPSAEQVKTAHQMIDNGASLIIGHHPHVIQPIEKYNGGLIAYSLGNFIFDYSFFPPTTRSYILKAKINLNNKKISYSTYPTQITDNYRVILKDNPFDLKKIIPLDSREKILKTRNLYRKYALAHIIKNFYRYKDKKQILRWIMKRMTSYIKNFRKEKKDPMEVYKWN